MDEKKRQERYLRLQCIFMAIAALCCVGVFVLVCTAMPKLMDVAEQLEGVLTNLKGVSQQLSQADLAGMAENVDRLAVTSQQGVETAMEKLNTIDLVTLNKAIADLADVVEPLARFFNVFN